MMLKELLLTLIWILLCNQMSRSDLQNSHNNHINVKKCSLLNFYLRKHIKIARNVNTKIKNPRKNTRRKTRKEGLKNANLLILQRLRMHWEEKFVGGLPMAPIQDGPVVPNAYNYDPKAEIMKLGTGQLQSAYRKARTVNDVKVLLYMSYHLYFNFAIINEKKIYKLEPKHHIEDDVEDGTELLHDVEPSGTANPIPTVSRASFIPRLNDYTNAPVTTKTDQRSPVPKRVVPSQEPGPMFERSPIQNSSAGIGTRSGRSSFSEFSGIRSSWRDSEPLRQSENQSTPSYIPNQTPTYSRNASFDTSPQPMTPSLSNHGSSSPPQTNYTSPGPIREHHSRLSEGEQFPMGPPKLLTPKLSLPSNESWRSPNSNGDSNRRPTDPRRARPNQINSLVEKIPTKLAIAQLHDIVRELNEVNAAI
uniref:TGFb_propeptide domain-containing protein n=1 Tax=Heterorhabditis bacteriophora TaxID=37862 RepID=A0A1I7WQX5_HETBA